jgi:hypothetical protein
MRLISFKLCVYRGSDTERDRKFHQFSKSQQLVDYLESQHAIRSIGTTCFGD